MRAWMRSWGAALDQGLHFQQRSDQVASSSPAALAMATAALHPGEILDELLERIHCLGQLHKLRPADAGKVGRDGDRVLQVAHAVDQADVHGVLSGPDPASGDLIDALDRHARGPPPRGR